MHSRIQTVWSSRLNHTNPLEVTLNFHFRKQVASLRTENAGPLVKGAHRETMKMAEL